MTGRVDSALPIIQIYLYMALQDKHDTKLIIYMNQNNNTMEYIIKESREIVWCERDDRHILILRENNDIVGLNFMQGDAMDVFKEYYNRIDLELTMFYQATLPYLRGIDELDRINQAIWAFHEFNVMKDLTRYEDGDYTCDTFISRK